MIVIFISFFFVFIPTMIFPITHKVLRNKKVYFLILISTILFAFFSLFVLEDNPYNKFEKGNKLVALSPLTFVILYRFGNSISQYLYKRPIYFSSGTYNIFHDNESNQSTWLELLIQMILFFIPFIWILIGEKLFE